MQDISDFIENLPVEERAITKMLRNLILEAEPRISEKLSYGVPYFSRHRRLFFLWPASTISAPRTSTPVAPKVTLGFCYGNLLSDDQKLLVRERRKQVYTIPLFSVGSTNMQQISEIVREAIMVDEQFFGRKRTKSEYPWRHP